MLERKIHFHSLTPFKGILCLWKRKDQSNVRSTNEPPRHGILTKRRLFESTLILVSAFSSLKCRVYMMIFLLQRYKEILTIWRDSAPASLELERKRTLSFRFGPLIWTSGGSSKFRRIFGQASDSRSVETPHFAMASACVSRITTTLI